MRGSPMRFITWAKLFLARRLHRVADRCMAAEDYNHAVLSYQIALWLSPDDLDAYRSLEHLLFFLGDLNGCLSLVTDWLGHHPSDQMSHLRAAYLHIQRRRWDAAERHLLSVLADGPPSPAASICLAAYHLSKSQLFEAQEHVNAALSVSPSHYDALLMRAQILS